MRDPQMTSHALSRSRTKVETPIAAAWLRQTRVNVWVYVKGGCVWIHCCRRRKRRAAVCRSQSSRASQHHTVQWTRHTFSCLMNPLFSQFSCFRFPVSLCVKNVSLKEGFLWKEKVFLSKLWLRYHWNSQFMSVFAYLVQFRVLFSRSCCFLLRMNIAALARPKNKHTNERKSRNSLQKMLILPRFHMKALKRLHASH